MKKLLITMLLSLMMAVSFAQVTRYRAYSVCYAKENDTTKEMDWSKETPSTILIVQSESTFTIYAKANQLFSIVSRGNNEIIGTGYCTDFRCVDNEGVQCTIKKCDVTDGSYTFFVMYGNYIFVYYTLLEKKVV